MVCAVRPCANSIYCTDYVSVQTASTGVTCVARCCLVASGRSVSVAYSSAMDAAQSLLDAAYAGTQGATRVSSMSATMVSGAAPGVTHSADVAHLQRLYQAQERIVKIVQRTDYIVKVNRLVPGAITEQNVERWMPPEAAHSSSFQMPTFMPPSGCPPPTQKGLPLSNDAPAPCSPRTPRTA